MDLEEDVNKLNEGGNHIAACVDSILPWGLGLGVVLLDVVSINAVNPVGPFLGNRGNYEVMRFKSDDGRECRLMGEDRRFAIDGYFLEVEGKDYPIKYGEIRTDNGNKICFGYGGRHGGGGTRNGYFFVEDSEGNVLKVE